MDIGKGVRGMEAESSKIDIGFMKAYLESCIKLETQKRIAEETFNKLKQDENKWKQEMSYKAKKQYSRVSILDMIIMAGKGFGIWLILSIILLIADSALGRRLNYNIVTPIIDIMVLFIILAAMIILVIVYPIYEKVTDHKFIRDKFAMDKKKESDIQQQGNNALYIIQNNKDKLQQAYSCIVNNLTNVYSANIIYKKYQTVEACAAIFDYLDSGRCYTLEGPHGAYNKYDDDSAKGIIISRLEEISKKMDVIISNQEKTYLVLQEIEKNVNGMDKNINDICDSLQTANGKLDEIANNTLITTWTSTVIAMQIPDWKEEAKYRTNKIYA